MVSISIVGAGNVAYHLGRVFIARGLTVRYVCNRTPEKGEELAKRLGASYVDHVSKMEFKPHELVFLCVGDDTILEIAHSRTWNDALLVHTSGSFETDQLNTAANYYGAFYPFQTFRKEIDIEWKEVPICVEGESEESAERLKQLGQLMAENVIVLSSEKRKKLHLMGVITNNFVYYLINQVKQYAHVNELPLSFIHPLLSQTVSNVLENAMDLQTGPAKRGDKKTMLGHLDLLKNDAELYSIYKELSKAIYKKYHHEEFEL
jgi:predicted short-subunit dehydrogenase-like oxidoreductase (DUF2520 family)